MFHNPSIAMTTYTEEFDASSRNLKFAYQYANMESHIAKEAGLTSRENVVSIYN